MILRIARECTVRDLDHDPCNLPRCDFDEILHTRRSINACSFQRSKSETTRAFATVPSYYLSCLTFLSIELEPPSPVVHADRLNSEIVIMVDRGNRRFERDCINV